MAESIAVSSTKQQFLTTYDVFLNHRGSDTKGNFVCPLQEKLREKGIEPFVDKYAIHHGENVFITIEEAIRRAHMHIAIFSINYAQSTYCLNELCQMILSGKPILTVFYDVEPEHVRRPRRPCGPYEEAFKKHDKREKPEDVKRWVSALEGAADIRGFIRANYRTDDELERAIILEVEKLRSPQSLTVPPRAGQYDWKSHYYKLPTEGRGILFFAAKSIGYHFRIALSSEPQVTYPMYEIVIRAGVTLKSTIRRNVSGNLFHDVCLVPGVVIDPNFGNVNQYWLSIDVETQLIQVGRGKQLDLASVFCVYKDLDFIGKTQYIAFSSWEEPVTYSNISVAFMATSSDLIQNSIEQLWNMSEVGILPESSSLLVIVQPMHAIFDWSRHYKLSSAGQGFVLFSAETNSDVHVAISPRPETMDPHYHLVIGGQCNTMSAIRRGWNAENLCRVPTGLINPHTGARLNQFWVSINAETQLIQIGRGNQPDLGSVICIYKDINFIHEAQYVCFTSWNVPVIYSNISVASPPTINQQPLNERELVQEPSDPRILELGPMRGVYNWAQHYQLPKQGQGFVAFVADGSNDVHVAISPEPRSMDPMYEILIGGWRNTRSVIRRRAQGPALCTVLGGLVNNKPQSDSRNYLWVSIDKKARLIQVGRGKQPDVPSVFCVYKDLDFVRRAQYICFSSWNASVTYSDISVGSVKGVGWWLDFVRGFRDWASHLRGKASGEIGKFRGFSFGKNPRRIEYVFPGDTGSDYVSNYFSDVPDELRHVTSFGAPVIPLTFSASEPL